MLSFIAIYGYLVEEFMEVGNRKNYISWLKIFEIGRDEGLECKFIKNRVE